MRSSRVVSSLSSERYSSDSRFGHRENSGPDRVIENDDDLDGYWKGMESRVTNRKKRTSMNIGRGRVPKVDEDVWGEAGLYQCAPTCPRYIDANTLVNCDHSCKTRPWKS